MDDLTYFGFVMDGPMKGRAHGTYVYDRHHGQWWLDTRSANLWKFLSGQEEPDNG